MATTPDYTVNYDDKRLTEVNADKKLALGEVEVTYGNMIKDSNKYYDKQIDAVKAYDTQQRTLQNRQTDLAIEQINQQKEQAKQDYTKEQSGAYVDWQKQSNQYGANAEQTAAQGMTNTGFSESSQVSMYNTYQNRVATARESYQRAVLNYDNMIKEARLKNSAALAEIAYNSLQKQLELSLAGFQYKNELVIAKTDKKMAVDEMYHNRWQDVLNQINTENAMAENVRQFDKEYEEGVRQFNAEMAYKNATLAEQKRQINATQSGGRISKGQQAKTVEKAVKGVKSSVKAGAKAAFGGNSTKDAEAYLNALIASGASKDKVANEIAIALRDGAITNAQAQKLRNTFTPRGVQYN